MRAVVIGGLKMNAACFQVVIRDPKDNAALRSGSNWSPKKTTLRAFKKTKFEIPKENNAACLQEIIGRPNKQQMHAFRSSFEVPKKPNLHEFSSSSFEVAKRKALGRRAHKSTARNWDSQTNRRPGIQISPPVPQILSPAGTQPAIPGFVSPGPAGQ
jgi:hypothetical protein